MIDIKYIQKIASDERNVILTSSIADRICSRKASKDDLFNVIMNGEIIEQYPKDYPHTGCLILGYSMNGRTLHTVCALGKDKGEDKLWLVTVYEPDTIEFEEDLKTRRS